MDITFRFLFSIACVCYSTFTAMAQEKQASDATEIAKKLANPIASLISVPFQNNLDVGINDSNGWRNTLNVQPVIPLKLSEKINLIARWVQPIILQQCVLDGKTYQSGLSDAVVSAFLSPSKVVNGLAWGAGPVFLVPVATSELLGTKKFGIGPTAVALKQTHGWTLGVLVNQIWSVAGNADRTDVNQMYVQPFVVYNWKSGAGLALNAEITQNWQASTTTAFLIPAVSGITKLGKQLISLQIGPRIPIAWAENSKADFGIRTAIIFVYPKK